MESKEIDKKPIFINMLTVNYFRITIENNFCFLLIKRSVINFFKINHVHFFTLNNSYKAYPVFQLIDNCCDKKIVELSFSLFHKDFVT